MAAITYDEWSGGLDRRLSINVQPASQLWVLRNCYITLAKRIAKRPGLTPLAQGLAGTVGLRAFDGKLKVFALVGDSLPLLPTAFVDAILLTNTTGTNQLRKVYYADQFQGFPYLAVQVRRPGFPSGFLTTDEHHYVDGGPSTYVTDAPHTARSLTKAAERLFAASGLTTKYCAAGDARDWTTASDAGFLPTSLQQDGNVNATAVGTFQDALVVFFPDGAQIWDVATDPTANAIRKRLYGKGTQAPSSIAPFANDLAFLSPSGFRSMTVSSQTDRIDDTDFGVPIDKLVVPDITASAVAPSHTEDILSAWIPQLGQYWTIFDMGTYSKVWVYTYSRSSKIACWSEYIYPFKFLGIASLNGKAYVRTADQLFQIDQDAVDDAGTMINCEVQMAFQDAKTPGVGKQWWGADFVAIGTPNVSYLYDPRSQTKETVPMTIPGDTRPGEFMPVEVVAPAIAPIFRHAKLEAFELDAVTLYFQALGVSA